MKKRKKKRLSYQKNVVKLPHMAPMRMDELEKILFMVMDYADKDVAYIHDGKVSHLENAWEHRLVEIGLVIKRYNALESHSGKRLIGARQLIAPFRSWTLRNIKHRIGQTLLDEKQYPRRIS